ncbi:arabinan endo-1,5-alpha-L-arabinosidase [Rhodohalobacter sp. 8-1]|uniref:arabinan endo-1,5-alpha-L-arabinosidase n=1 Tax=Rhodohalobacter sp. 8-1 TaxID=3131972 RepID=UPI00403F85E2
MPLEDSENMRDNLHLNISVHDPSMIEHDGRYYMFHTGRGIANWVSRDMENWIRLDPVFESAPEWTQDVVPEFGNHIWAPSITFHNGTYYLYYSVSSFGRNNSAIGLVTNQTLNPDDPEFEWVDQGIVIESVPGRDMWNAIDATLSFDEDGTPWLAFGSHWMGIKLVQLEDDLKTVAITPEGNEWYTIAERHRYWKLDERDAGDSANPELDYDELYPDSILELNRQSESGAIEAPFIFKKGDYYYLFVSWDRCCRGVNSTYKVVVGRSESITGPYLSKTGQRMDYGGGSIVVKGNDEYAAVGHNSVYTFDGTDYLVAHGYDLSDEGRSKLVILEVTWDDDDWPVVELDRD